MAKATKPTKPSIAVFGDVTFEDPRSLVPVDWNTQERTRDELDRIKASILVHGLVGPIAARPSDRSIAGGHGRLDALLELLDEGYALSGAGVPVVWKECDDAELMALNMALNNAVGQPNFERVALAIRRIEGLGRADLLEHGTGFTALQIKDIRALALEPAASPERIERENERARQAEPGNEDYDQHLADGMAAQECDPYEWSELTFAVSDADRETVDDALARARDALGTENDAEALTHICKSYLTAAETNG